MSERDRPKKYLHGMSATNSCESFPHCPRSGKRSWAARRVAKQALRQNRDLIGLGMTVYRCSCGYFHWGHR